MQAVMHNAMPVTPTITRVIAYDMMLVTRLHLALAVGY